MLGITTSRTLLRYPEQLPGESLSKSSINGKDDCVKKRCMSTTMSAVREGSRWIGLSFFGAQNADKLFVLRHKVLLQCSFVLSSCLKPAVSGAERAARARGAPAKRAASA
jgi:hypothetical protein